MQARLASLESENAGLKSKNETLEADKAAAEEQASAIQAAKAASDAALAEAQAQLKAEVEKGSPLSFTIEEDSEELDVKAGDEFEFTAPTCTWDDNSIVNFRELAASKEKKDQELYAEICAHLVQRKSGLIRRKEK